MSGSHNLKYYVWSIMLVLCKRNKVQSHNITKQFKWSRSENTANETREIENIQNEQQTEQEAIEQLERDHSMVVTEASSCSASTLSCKFLRLPVLPNQQLLSQQKEISQELRNLHKSNFTGVTTPNIPCISTPGFFADHKTWNSTIQINSQRYQEDLKNKKKLHNLGKKTHQHIEITSRIMFGF